MTANSGHEMANIDPNKIIADLFATLIKESAKLSKDAAKALFQKLIDLMRKDLQPYMIQTVKRCSVVKTILHREEPAAFWNLYVNQKLKCRNKIYADKDLPPALFEMKSAVIEGSAGSGKSMFMRYLFLTLCANPAGKVPLFIELRNLNSFQTKDLLTFVFHSVQKPGGVLTKEQFIDGLKSGMFTIIFDGFDEVDFDQRQGIERQILDLREEYPTVIIVVSSRPDDRFQAWTQFYVISVLPMDSHQITELINNLDYDPDTTEKFLKALSGGLFNKHSSFLSNPLLAIMMLITFDQYAHIPDKIHIFYEHAFDALFSRHDSSKPGVFKRKTYSGLPIDDFKNILSSFCMATYAKETFHFTQTQVRQFVRKAIEFERKSVKPDDYLTDLLESVCILQRDGLAITFSHRSFQEYFAAYFLTRNPSSSLDALLDQISRRSEDNVLGMAFDMNSNLIESAWIIPRLRALNAAVADIDVKAEPVKYFTTMYGPLRVVFRRGPKSNMTLDLMMASEGRGNASFIFALYGLYPETFGVLRRGLTKRVKSEVATLKEVQNSLVAAGRMQVVSDSRKGPHKDVLLTPDDGEWLNRTGHGRYIASQQQLLKDLLKRLEAEQGRRQTALGTMFA